jgi:co-chaperonin GroES (HSP10)
MLRPLGFLVLVRPDQAKDALKTDKIALPDSVTDKWRIEVDTGHLVSIGHLAWKGIKGGDDTPWAKVGDHVVYVKYGGKIMEDPETREKLILLKDEDIIGAL